MPRTCQQLIERDDGMAIHITLDLSKDGTDAEEIRALGRYLSGYKERSGSVLGPTLTAGDVGDARPFGGHAGELDTAVDLFSDEARPPANAAWDAWPAAGAPFDPPEEDAPGLMTPPPPPPPPPLGWHTDTDSGALIPDAHALAPPPPSASAEEPVLRDINGVVWDPAIHAATKTTNKDKTWRLRRNPGSPSEEPAVAPPPPPPPPANPAVVLRARIVAALTNGSLTATESAAAQNRVGLTGGLPALHNRPDLVPALYLELGWEQP